MTLFNPEQQLAIDALNSNVIVSASAGAGKTTVLVARLMKRILKDGVKISEIVAMTFTEAAASEMKVRLLDALNKENTINPSDFLSEQISLVETAQISTIHSFCLNIIKNYGYVLGIDPRRSQNIMDDAMVKLYSHSAFEAVLEKRLKENFQDTIDLLDLFSSNPLNFTNLEKAIVNCSKWLLSKKDPDIEIEKVTGIYETQSFDNLPSTIKKTFLFNIQDSLSDISELLQNLVIVSDSTFDYSDKKQQAFQEQNHKLLECIASIRRILKEFETGNFNSYNELKDVLNITVKPYGKSEDYTKIRSTLEDVIDKFVAGFKPINETMMLLNKNASVVSSLLTFTQEYLKTYNQLKIENSTFDFNDFEILALQILRYNDGFIASQIRKLYQEIMVDEFQDTNEHQDEIIRLISNGSNIFRVGDVKQSIYKFRGAKPSIMKTLIDENSAKNLYLSYNYRSKQDIVSYNNYVFDQLMQFTNTMRYTEYDHVNTGVASQNIDSHPVEFHIIERGDDTFEDTKNQQQAQHIAQEIIKFHKKGYAFKDMVILVRGHSAKAYLKEAFENANIPHFIDDQTGFYQSKVVQEILSFLTFANDPHDYHLAKVLLSSFVNYSVDDIARIRLANPNSLKEGLQTFDADIYNSLMSFVNTWKHKDIVTILQEMIAFNNTYNLRMTLQDKTNVDFLIDKAVQYQNSNIPTLSGFIRFVKAFEQDTSSEASPISAEADVVTSMTIHKSKGLQFPIVFLWGMGPHRVRDHSETLITDDDLGIGLYRVEKPYRVVESNIIRDLIEYKQNNEEIEEMLRLLYVALTRPQKHLIIVDAVKEFKIETLSRRLLYNHSRKSELLYAASPKSSTVLKKIDANDLPNVILDSNDTNNQDSFKYAVESIEVPSVYYSNPTLNLSDYSKEGMAFGTTLHEAIETLPHSIWNMDLLKDYSPAIQERLIRYNINSFTQELYNFEEIFHETSYMKDDGEGIIDFYAVNDDRVVLVDFKSDNADVETLLERYKEQIATYLDVLKTIYPNKSLEAYIYSFKLDQYILL